MMTWNCTRCETDWSYFFNSVRLSSEFREFIVEVENLRRQDDEAVVMWLGWMARTRTVDSEAISLSSLISFQVMFVLKGP